MHWKQELGFFQRFHVRITLWLGLGLGILLTGVIGWFHRVAYTAELSGLRDRIGVTAQLVAATVDPALIAAPTERTPERRALATWLARISKADEEIAEIYVFSNTARPYVFFEVANSSSLDIGSFNMAFDASRYPVLQRGNHEPVVEERVYDDSLSGYAPVVDATGRSVGLVGVDVEARRIVSLERRIQRATLLVGVGAVGLLGLLTWFAGRSIHRPLGAVIDASDAVARGELEVQVPMAPRSDEFGILGRRFEAMVRGLREREVIRATFGRYVSEKVAAVLLSQPGGAALGGEEREITVLFSDVMNYSTIAEHVPPHEVVAVLNEYFGAMSEIVDAHGGCVIEFLGDAVLAVFNAPVALEDHPRRAVECALAMRARLATLNEAWEESGRAEAWKSIGVPALRMRVGLNTGRVVAGNLGSATRMKYAVIGDTVNLAARLEQANKDFDTEILAAESTVRGAGPVAGSAQDRGEIKVKGRERSVRVFSL